MTNSLYEKYQDKPLYIAVLIALFNYWKENKKRVTARDLTAYITKVQETIEKSTVSGALTKLDDIAIATRAKKGRGQTYWPSEDLLYWGITDEVVAETVDLVQKVAHLKKKTKKETEDNNKVISTITSVENDDYASLFAEPDDIEKPAIKTTITNTKENTLDFKVENAELRKTLIDLKEINHCQAKLIAAYSIRNWAEESFGSAVGVIAQINCGG